MEFIKLFFLLLVGHSLADTALQPDEMSRGKRRKAPINMAKVPKGQKPMKLWWMWLTHHSLIHGGMVFLVTGRIGLGIIETISHWIIDFFKSENVFNPKIDQLLHLSMKFIYCFI